MSASTSILTDSADLFADSLRRGVDAIDALLSGARSPLREVASVLGGSRSCRERPPHRRPARFCGPSGCEIPPPCWYPRFAGEVHSHVCPGGTATLRIVVENCGPGKRTVRLRSDSGVELSPDTLDLGPMERAVATATRKGDADAPCEGREALVWIAGCHEHFVRWTVSPTKRGSDCCHEIHVEDCPDVLHHWYDHFYCQHPCAPTLRADAA